MKQGFEKCFFRSKENKPSPFHHCRTSKDIINMIIFDKLILKLSLPSCQNTGNFPLVHSMFTFHVFKLEIFSFVISCRLNAKLAFKFFFWSQKCAHFHTSRKSWLWHRVTRTLSERQHNLSEFFVGSVSPGIYVFFSCLFCSWHGMKTPPKLKKADKNTPQKPGFHSPPQFSVGSCQCRVWRWGAGSPLCLLFGVLWHAV